MKNVDWACLVMCIHCRSLDLLLSSGQAGVLTALSVDIIVHLPVIGLEVHSAWAGNSKEAKPPTDEDLHCAARLAFIPPLSFPSVCPSACPSLPFFSTSLLFFHYSFFSATCQTIIIAPSGIKTQGGHMFSALYMQRRLWHWLLLQ